MTTKFETIAEAPGFRMGAFGAVVVTVYREVVNSAALNELDLRQADLLTRHPKLFTFTVVMGKGLSAPTSEVRQLAAKLQAKYASRSTGAAVVFSAGGLAGIVARGFMAGLSMVAPPEMNQKTFKTVAEAVAWARSIPSQVPEVAVADLLKAIEEFVAGK